MGWTMQGQKHQRILLLDVETPAEPSHSGRGKWYEKKMTKSDKVERMQPEKYCLLIFFSDHFFFNTIFVLQYLMRH